MYQNETDMLSGKLRERIKELAAAQPGVLRTIEVRVFSPFSG